MMMTGGGNYYPTRDQTIEYLRYYESKYNLPVNRPVDVLGVSKEKDGFTLRTSQGPFYASAVVSATGSFTNPYIPALKGTESFKGEIIHSSQYHSPDQFSGKKVVIVGEGNSGAQILAEVSKVAETLWVTQKEPRFLPDHIDGRYLFDAATQMYQAGKNGQQYKPPSLGDIVMVDSVRDARLRGILKRTHPFERLAKDSIIWSDGLEEKVDSIIFCTGFKPSFKYLNPLLVPDTAGKSETIGTRSKHVGGLWLVGYGNWTGFASATLIGVGRSAKTTVEEIRAYVSSLKESLPS